MGRLQGIGRSEHGGGGEEKLRETIRPEREWRGLRGRDGHIRAAAVGRALGDDAGRNGQGPTARPAGEPGGLPQAIRCSV